MEEKPITSAEISRLFTLILDRFDRIEKMLTPITQEVSEDEIIDSRKIRLLTKMSDTTLWRRRNDGSMPFFRHGGKIYYLKSKVMQAIQQSDREMTNKK